MVSLYIYISNSKGVNISATVQGLQIRMFLYLVPGSNRYCLDKNYAGVLIIWDRMFGTFEQEKEDENIVYGLVDQPQYFNPIKHQVRH